MEAVDPETHKRVGVMRWEAHTEGQFGSTINEISVKRDVRRKGIATEMFHQSNLQAKQFGINPPRHSPIKTEDGAAWVAGMYKNSHKTVRPPKAAPGVGQESIF
jgi:hypothetical protein